MKKSRFTETQIVGILKEAESGLLMADLLRSHGISGATFYKWRSKNGGLEASELKWVKEPQFHYLATSKYFPCGYQEV